VKVNRFVDTSFLKEELQAICDSEGLVTSGDKEALIARLRSKANYSIVSFLWNIKQDDLKDICFDLDLKVGGTVDDL